MERNILEKKLKYIDLHTHKQYQDPEVVCLYSLLPKEASRVVLNNYFTIGCHPWYADNYPVYRDVILQYSKNDRCLAIGEIGMDRTKGELLVQQKIFEAQLQLAQELNKPVIIHCVRAYDVLLSIRKSFPGQRWIIHGFNGNEVLARQLLDKEIYLSIGTALLNSKSKIAKCLHNLPLNYIFLETDVSNIHIKDVYFAAARLTGKSKDELQLQIMQNFKTVFHVALV